jgi:hypothetical protein
MAYVAALPESAVKASLRGLVVAARAIQGDNVDEPLLIRMRAVVTESLKKDPMRALQDALQRESADAGGRGTRQND